MLITKLDFNWPNRPGSIKAWATVSFYNEISVNNITLMEEDVDGTMVRSVRYPSRNVAQRGQPPKYVSIFTPENERVRNEIETRLWTAYDALRPSTDAYEYEEDYPEDTGCGDADEVPDEPAA